MFDDVASPADVSLLGEGDEREVLDRWRKAFTAAQDSRMQYEDKWLRYYRQYRMHHDRVVANDWRSQKFIPLLFYSVQSVLPKIVAQLPEPTVLPVGPMDEAGAPKMETTLRWCAQRTKLQLRIFEQFWSALVYGTGVLKVRVGQQTVTRSAMQPVMQPLNAQQPVMDPETGAPMLDFDGAPVMGEAQFGQMPTGEMELQTSQDVSYIGPVADYLDLWNIYPAPEASDVSDARFIIHRSWQPRAWVEQRIKSGYFTVPEGVGFQDFWSVDDDPKFRRLSRIGYSGSRSYDPTAQMCQLWECWDRYEGDVTVVMNERYVVRRVKNPYDHGMLPFVRAVDHLIPGEFWGQGECEILGGLQDIENTIWNSRLDELRLKLNKMFMVDEQALVDPRDITRLRPGAFVRVNNPNGLPIQNVIAPLDFGDITPTAYTEAAEIERLMEKAAGTTPAATGTGEVQPADTATSVALFSEAAGSRLLMKLRVAELGGLKDLMEMFGSVIQQYTPPDMVMRITEGGQTSFEPIGPEVVYSAFDYEIMPQSSAISESIRKDQDMSLMQAGAGLVDPMGVPVANTRALWEDLLRDFGKKDVARYTFTPPPPMPMGPGGEALPPELAALAGGPPMNGQGPPPEQPM